MKKKFIIVLLLFVCTLCFAVGLTACNLDDSVDASSGEQTSENVESENNNSDDNIEQDSEQNETHTHNYTYEVTKEATCTESGIITYTCTICENYFTVSEEPLGHTSVESTENKVAATCTEDGSYDSVVYCSVCGEELSRTTVTVPKLAHTYSGYFHDSDGHWQVCSVCNTVTESLSHTINNYTCDICGYNIAEACSAIITENEYTTVDSFTFSYCLENDSTYFYPWIAGTDNIGGVSNYIMTTNAGVDDSCSFIIIDVSLKKNQAVLLDYFASTEDQNDLLYIQIDTELQFEISGLSLKWQTCLAYVALYDGDYQIILCYQKDSSKNINDDAVYVSNLRIVDTSEISSLSTDILYNAATNYADSSIDVSNYGEGYGYYNYVDVYLASDGYYHVGCKTDGSDPDDDPYLLADLCNGTSWYSLLSIKDEVYGLADEIDKTLGVGSVDAFKYYIELQDYCGYVPVNAELHDLLVAFVAEFGRMWGDLLDDQWLELCKYYVHYGADHDSCYSINNLIELYLT